MSANPAQSPGQSALPAYVRRARALEHMFQVLGEERGRVVASAGLFLQAFEANQLEIAIELELELARRADWVQAHELIDPVCEGELLVGDLPGEELIKNDPQAIDIGAVSQRSRVAGDLLWSHVETEHSIARLEALPLFAQALGRTKVCD